MGRVYSVSGTGVGSYVPTVVVLVPTSYQVTSSNYAPSAGVAVMITAQLLDQFGAALGGAARTITWTKSGAGGSFASGTSTTNPSGVAIVSFTGNPGTTHTVTANDGPVVGTSPNIVVGASSGRDPLIQAVIDGAYNGKPAKLYATTDGFPVPASNLLVGVWTLAAPAGPLANVISDTEIAINLVATAQTLVGTADATVPKYLVIDPDGTTPIWLSVGLSSDTFNPRVVVDDMGMYGGDVLTITSLHVVAANVLDHIAVTASTTGPESFGPYTTATQLKNAANANVNLIGRRLTPSVVTTAGPGGGTVTPAIIVTDRFGNGQTLTDQAGAYTSTPPTTVEHVHVTDGTYTGDSADVTPGAVNGRLTQTVLWSGEATSAAPTSALVTVPAGSAMLVQQLNAGTSHVGPTLTDSSGTPLGSPPFAFTEIAVVNPAFGAFLSFWLSPKLPVDFTGKVILNNGLSFNTTGFVSKVTPDIPVSSITAVSANTVTFSDGSGTNKHPSVLYAQAFGNTRNLGVGGWGSYGNQLADARTGWTEKGEVIPPSGQPLCLQVQTKLGGDSRTSADYPGAAPTLLWGLGVEIQALP